MDIRNYTWVNSFELTEPTPASVATTNKPESTQTSSTDSPHEVNGNELVTMKITIASIVGIVGTVIIMVCGFLIYRWNKKRKEQPTPTLPIPGTTTIRYNHNEYDLPGTAVEYNRSSYIPA